MIGTVVAVVLMAVAAAIIFVFILIPVLKLLGKLFGHIGRTLVDIVADGRSALDRLREGDFQAVVLDVMLPGMNGFDVLRSIRADGRTRETPVIVLTAKGQANDRKTAEAIGASAFAADAPGANGRYFLSRYFLAKAAMASPRSSAVLCMASSPR